MFELVSGLQVGVYPLLVFFTSSCNTLKVRFTENIVNKSTWGQRLCEQTYSFHKEISEKLTLKSYAKIGFRAQYDLLVRLQVTKCTSVNAHKALKPQLNTSKHVSLPKWSCLLLQLHTHERRQLPLSISWTCCIQKIDSQPSHIRKYFLPLFKLTQQHRHTVATDNAETAWHWEINTNIPTQNAPDLYQKGYPLFLYMSFYCC